MARAKGIVEVRSQGIPMDFNKFYLSPEGRANRKQFWLWLVMPLTTIKILLVLYRCLATPC